MSATVTILAGTYDRLAQHDAERYALQRAASYSIYAASSMTRQAANFLVGTIKALPDGERSHHLDEMRQALDALERHAAEIRAVIKVTPEPPPRPVFIGRVPVDACAN